MLFLSSAWDAWSNAPHLRSMYLSHCTLYQEFSGKALINSVVLTSILVVGKSLYQFVDGPTLDKWSRPSDDFLSFWFIKQNCLIRVVISKSTHSTSSLGPSCDNLHRWLQARAYQDKHLGSTECILRHLETACLQPPVVTKHCNLTGQKKASSSHRKPCTVHRKSCFVVLWAWGYSWIQAHNNLNKKDSCCIVCFTEPVSNTRVKRTQSMARVDSFLVMTGWGIITKRRRSQVAATLNLL